MSERYRVGERIKASVRGEEIEGYVLYPFMPGRYCVVEASGNGRPLRHIVEQKDILTPPQPIVKHTGIDILFFGNGQLAARVLEELYLAGTLISSVITNPDKEQGRGRKKGCTAVKQVAVRYGLPVNQPENIGAPAFLKRLRHWHPDLGIVVDFGILPSEILSIPQFGFINLHTSLLPRHRGASPLRAAIRNGDNHTGLTVFKVNEKIDQGDIVSNLFMPIIDNDTYGTVFERTRKKGPQMVIDAIGIVCAGRSLVSQDWLARYIEPTPYAPKFSRADLRIDWSLDADCIDRFVRAYSPSPGAWTELCSHVGDKKTTVKIFRVADRGKEFGMNPGDWFKDNNCLMVCCGDYRIVEILEIQQSGGRLMDGRTFANGLKSKWGNCR